MHERAPAGSQRSVYASFASDVFWMRAVQRTLAVQSAIEVVDEPAGASLTLFPRSPRAVPVILGPPFDSRLDLSDADVDARALGELARKLRSQTSFDLLHYPRVRTRSNLLSALPSSGLPYGLSDAGASAFCDVSHPDALKALSKDNLRNVDRLRRRAEKDFGTLAIDRITDPAALHTSAFDRFVALEDAGWKGTAGAGTSLAADTRAQAFFREVMRLFGEDARARIDFLSLAGRDAAAQLMVRAGPTWFLLKIGYHPDFKDVGPGGILLKAFLEEMVANPDILEVNLTTNPPWAARWHFQTEPVYHVHIYNTTWRGRILYAARSLKELAKRLRDSYRAAQARRLAQTPPQ